MANRAERRASSGGNDAAGKNGRAVADYSAEFAARRNCGGKPMTAGERVIVQSEQGGQAEAVVMGRTAEGEVLIRTSRWSVSVAVPVATILRRLDRPTRPASGAA